MKSVIIYADESGTHDKTGQQRGAEYALIAGIAAPPSEWNKFCIEWRAVLNAYGAPYFHFSEWAEASAAIRHNREETPRLRRNPFYKWQLKRLDKFLLTLAKLAGNGNKVLIAGCARVSAFNQLKTQLDADNPENIQLGTNPFKYCMGEFFRVYHRETYLRWGAFKCPASFFFDHSDDREWRSEVNEVFTAFQTKDPRMKELLFGDKKVHENLPLQAADLLAYRIRQHVQNLSADKFELKEMDHKLLKNLLANYGVNPK